MSSLSGPSVDTFSDASALFVNRFIKTDTATPDETEAVDYRRWKEQNLQGEKTNAANRLREIQVEERRAADRRTLLKVKEEGWQCCIDSSNRDTNLYPNASAFTINMGQTFQNVIRARLISLEFPNVLNVVNKGNNTITWINLEDIDLDFPVYSVTIPVGTYNYKTLETQLNTMLHSSDLKRRNGLGTPHFFIVTLDRETDKVSFSSIIPQATGKDPLQTIQNSNRVRMTAKNHGFVTGDVVRVIGVQGSVGGIKAEELNGAFTIQVPVIAGVSSPDFFDYEIANVARGAVDNLSGGGSAVQIGKEAPFQFTFQNDQTNASPLLGFPSENSALPIPDSFLQSYVATIDQVIVGETTLIVAQAHGLVEGDRIYLNNFVVSPSIYNAAAHKGEFYVNRVISPDVFEIDFATTYITDVSTAFIGTRILIMYLPAHGFNRIVEFSTLPNNTGCRVVTLFPHNVVVGQTLFIRATLYSTLDFAGAFVVTAIVDDDDFQVSPCLTTNGNTIVSMVASADGATTPATTLVTTISAHGYSTGDTIHIEATGLTLPLKVTSVVVTKVVSDTSFTIDGAPEPLGAFDIPLNGLTGDGIMHDGQLLSHQDLTLYNASAVGGFIERDLNSTLFTVRRVLSPDFLAFTVKTGYSTYIDRGGGSMRISSLLHGWRGTQSNDQLTGAVYRPMALTGDSYCFLRVPSLGKYSSLINTGTVNNILSKVQLTSPPVTTLFNTAVSGTLEFRDGPLPTLSTIDFQWVDKNGDELDFGHFQWSCVLEFVTLNAANDYNYQPVRVYVPDPVDRIEWSRGSSLGAT